MIDFRQSEYVISIPEAKLRMKDSLPEIAFMGRSNVGKSTLINVLTGKTLAYSSKKAGKTRYLNYFLIDKKFYVVDTPGYGYTAYGNKEDINFSKMMESYFAIPTLKGAFLLLDARREPNKDDLLILDYLQEINMPTFIIYTKCDQAKQAERYQREKFAKEREIPYFMSSLKADKDKLRKFVLASLKEDR